MTYENYQIPEKHLRILQRQKAAKLTKQYVKEHGIEPPANVKAGFMDISEEEYLRYRDVFFAVDFAKGMPTESAIVNVPWERPNTRYNEYVQCVYNVVDTNNATKLFETYNYTSDGKIITYVMIDGVEIPVDDLTVLGRGSFTTTSGGKGTTASYGYVFDTLGTHRLDFLTNDSQNIHPVLFKNCKGLKEITFPNTIASLGGRETLQGCSNLEKITFLSPLPPSVQNNDVKNIKPLGKLYIPKGSFSNYETSAWLTYSEVVNTTYQGAYLTEYNGLYEWEVIEMDE